MKDALIRLGCQFPILKKAKEMWALFVCYVSVCKSMIIFTKGNFNVWLLYTCTHTPFIYTDSVHKLPCYYCFAAGFCCRVLLVYCTVRISFVFSLSFSLYDVWRSILMYIILLAFQKFCKCSKYKALRLVGYFLQ